MVHPERWAVMASEKQILQADRGGGGPAQHRVYCRYSVCILKDRRGAHRIDCGLVQLYDRGVMDVRRHPQSEVE